MKQFIVWCAIFLALAFGAGAQIQTNTAAPIDVKAASYALGVNLATSVSNNFRFLGATNMDIDELLGAMKVVLSGQTPRMTPKEAVASATSWTNAQRKAVGERNLAAEKAYIENFQKEPG